MYSDITTNWKPELISGIIFPILVAFVTYFLLKKIDEWKNRRSICSLGVIILESLIEEVSTGQTIMEQIKDNSNVNPPRAKLPNESYTGMNTIPDDVLLRIIQNSKKCNPVSFHPREIRTHCKNYFTHMNQQWESSLISGADWRPQTQRLINGGYLDSTKKVLQMLIQTKDLLDKNSKKTLPD
jgi:hypothetical protein